MEKSQGTVLENPIPLHTLFGWLSGDDDDKPSEPKCDFVPL